jgi:hypothetical protein
VLLAAPVPQILQPTEVQILLYLHLVAVVAAEYFQAQEVQEVIHLMVRVYGRVVKAAEQAEEELRGEFMVKQLPQILEVQVVQEMQLVLQEATIIGIIQILAVVEDGEHLEEVTHQVEEPLHRAGQEVMQLH